MKKEDLTKDSTIEMLVKFLEKTIEDKCPREKVSDYELGILVGQLKILDVIKSIR